MAGPGSLADLPVCGDRERDRLEVEEVLYIPLWAHKAATGEVLPEEAYSVSYPELDTRWDFDDPTRWSGSCPPDLTCWPDATGDGTGEMPHPCSRAMAAPCPGFAGLPGRCHLLLLGRRAALLRSRVWQTPHICVIWQPSVASRFDYM